MNSTKDDTETVPLWRLTPEQRQQIYDEEKRRIEQAAPVVSKKTKVVVLIYLLGCLLLYFGITNAVIDFWGTDTWRLEPEPGLFTSLVNSAAYLIRPFLAVVLTFWAVAIPLLLVWGLWSWGTDIVGFLKRLVNRDDD